MTKIFETERLIVRLLELKDADAYFDMMGNPNVMSLIPREVMSREESDEHLEMIVTNHSDFSDKKVWGIETKLENDFIGLCAFLKNNKNEDELGYRLREKFWRKGYGTEITKGLISFGFSTLNINKITADVATTNIGSIKILEKFMVKEDEFFNEQDECVDRRYAIVYNDKKYITFG